MEKINDTPILNFALKRVKAKMSPTQIFYSNKH